MGNQAGINNLSLPAVRLIDQLRKPGCPVCRAQDESIDLYLKNIFYENVNDPLFRDEFEKNYGFCPFHTTLVLEYGDPCGLAILYNGLISNHDILIRRASRCKCCTLSKEAEIRAIESIVELISEKIFYQVTSTDLLFCIGHFQSVIEKISGSEQKALLSVQRARLNEISRLLKEALRKMDYRAGSEELTEEEKIALDQSVKYFAGFAQLAGYLEEDK